MHNEFTNKNNTSILEYLEELGRNQAVYSERRDGLGPLLSDSVFYVYATETEIVLVLIDSEKGNRFKEKDDIVWDLALTCELFRDRFLRLSKHVPHISGVLLTSYKVIDKDVMQHIWETLDITVIDQVERLDSPSLPVNTDDQLSIAFPLIFLYEAEFSEEDYANAGYSLLMSIMEENPTLFYDTSELEDLDDEK
jgi:hypothetical protein